MNIAARERVSYEVRAIESIQISRECSDNYGNKWYKNLQFQIIWWTGNNFKTRIQQNQ